MTVAEYVRKEREAICVLDGLVDAKKAEKIADCETRAFVFREAKCVCFVHHARPMEQMRLGGL